MTIGVDVRDNAIVVMVVDPQGVVVKRASRDGATPASAAEAVTAVDDHAPKRVGAALRDPHGHAAADVVAAAAGAARVTAAPRVVTRGAAMAMAEQWLGAARGARHVVAISVTDCVDAGIVVDGRILEGAHGRAGGAGWLALNPVERDDYRRHGCLEAEVGANGIVRRLVWRLKSGDTSSVLEMAGGRLSEISVPHIFDAARQGDGVAVAVVRDTARYIGMAIGNLVAVIDPEVVVLGGLMADAADLLLEPLRSEAARRMSPTVADTLQIVPGILGDEAPALGAARAAMLEAGR
jgi:glucokinase